MSPPLSPLTRLGLICIALLCVVPFLQPWHRYPLTGFYSEWLAFVLGLGVMAPLLERRSWQTAGVPWLALAPFALAFLLVVHGALDWSPYFGQALTGALYLIWAGMLVIAARALAQACGPATVYAALAAGLAAGGLLSVLAGVIQHFNLVTPLNAFIARPGSAAIFGNLGQANHFATHATLGLLSLTYLYAAGRVPVAAGVVATVPMLFVLGLSGSRSVLLYLVAAFALAAWLRKADEGPSARRLFMATGAFIIAYYVMQLLVDAGWFRVADRDSITAVERLFSGATSVTERFSLWRAAWAMTLEHPLAGVGWGGFSMQYFNYITALDTAGLYQLYHHAHNIALHLLAETGVPGALLVVVPAVVWLQNVWTGVRGAAQWWLLALAAVLGLHSLLEFPLWYAYFLGPAALLLGAAPVLVFMPRLERIGPLLAAALLGVGIFNLATLWLDYRDFERVFHSRTERLRDGGDTGGNTGESTAETMRRLHRNPVLTPYIELASALPLAADAADLDARRFITERTLRFAPLATLAYREVLLLALADRPEEALALLLRARRAYPAPPPEFARDLDRLAREHPARMRPLVESGLLSADP